MGTTPGIPWEGRGSRADRVLAAGLVISALYGLLLLPAAPALVGTHPALLELLRGSVPSMITMGGLARTGQASVVVALLAGLPGYMMFDWLYWWAGRRWGAPAIDRFLGAPAQAARRRRRLHAAMERFGAAAIVFAAILPVPSVLIYAAAGLAGMRLAAFLLLDLLGALWWVGLMVGLGFWLGQPAVDVARTISHYALVITLGLVVVAVAWQVMGARRAQR
jgi:membrane protein DedA with SNARE-associated domain